ncbi:MAG TPA: c-type cytochrome biogenesis protein CcmI [Gammaproteobacteria bacterium]
MNSVLFAVIGATLLAAFLYTLIRSMHRPRPLPTAGANEQLVVAIYQNRLQQLQLQFDNGELGQQDYEQAQQELSRTLAHELQTAAQTPAQPGKSGKLTAWALALIIPLLAVSMYLLLGKPLALDPGSVAAQQQLSIAAMVSQLEEKLQSDPDNVEGWRMLGRSYLALQNFEAARDSYAEAYRRASGNADIALDYAEAIAYANGNNLIGQPAELIERAVQADPANIRALVLRGVALHQQDKIAAAVEQWKKVLTEHNVDAQTRAVLQNMIAQAGGTAPEPAPSIPATGAAAVTAQVSLAPEFAASVAPDDTVFIFAQAAAGPKMPLAVVRTRVADLPLQAVLDDSAAMAPGMNLSAFNQVIVVARVSKSGNAMPASGDLQGSSPTIDPRQRPSVNVVIGTRVP